jgi:hypothetical protein
MLETDPVFLAKRTIIPRVPPGAKGVAGRGRAMGSRGPRAETRRRERRGEKSGDVGRFGIISPGRMIREGKLGKIEGAKVTGWR